MKPPSSGPVSPRSWAIRLVVRPWVHLLVGAAILLLDLLTGPFLLFPILFVVPVSLCAWFCSARLAYALAVLLPTGRLLVAEIIENPQPLPYIVANALIRVAVLLLLAFFVARTARQTKQLQERIEGLVTICAWSRTIQYEGEWISFEEYLKRRFDIDTSHGISPAEVQKNFRKAKQNSPIA